MLIDKQGILMKTILLFLAGLLGIKPAEAAVPHQSLPQEIRKLVTIGSVANSRFTINQNSYTYITQTLRLDSRIISEALKNGLGLQLNALIERDKQLTQEIHELRVKTNSIKTDTNKLLIAQGQQATKADILQLQSLLEAQQAFRDSVNQNTEAAIEFVKNCQQYESEAEFQQLIDLVQTNKLQEAQSLANQLYLRDEQIELDQKALEASQARSKRLTILGDAVYLHKDYVQAIEIFEKALTLYPKQPNILYKLADSYSSLPVPDFTKARRRVEYAIELYNDQSFESQRELYWAENLLGFLWVNIGDPKKAVIHLEAAKQCALRLDSGKDALLASTYTNLGAAYRNMEQPEEALKYFEKALVIKKEIYGEMHPTLGVAYNSLGLAYKALGQPAKAVKNYAKALTIKKAMYGVYAPSVGVTYNNMGILYRDIGQPHKAIKYLENALTTQTPQPLKGTVYNNLGLAYQDLGQYDKALDYFEKSLITIRGVYGENHPDIVLGYKNIALAYKEQGNISQAKLYYSKAKNLMDTGIFINKSLRKHIEDNL